MAGLALHQTEATGLRLPAMIKVSGVVVKDPVPRTETLFRSLKCRGLWASLKEKKNLPHLLNFAIIFRQFKCGDGEGETVKKWLLKIPILDYRSLATDGERKSEYFFIYSWFRIQKWKRKKNSCNNVSKYVTSIYGDLFTY